MIMNKQHHISFYLILLFAFIHSNLAKAQDAVHLFPDRSSCVSGDTIWFSTLIIPENENQNSNVVHIQLDNTGNRHITRVTVLCTNNQGQGYIAIPDSLSTGKYFLKAFVNGQKNKDKVIINQRMLTVYNRFDENLNMIQLPETDHQQAFIQSSEIKISTDNETTGTRKNINAKIEIPISYSADLSTLIVTAGMVDPLSEDDYSQYFPATQIENEVSQNLLTEKNGVLVNGKVLSSEDHTPVPNAIVLLSIPDTIPYFDYCISDSIGMFYFYLRDAVGKGNLVIQARSIKHPVCEIQILENYIETKELTGAKDHILNYDQKNYAEAIVNASYFDKLFNGYILPPSETFSIPMVFKSLFYGEPTATVYPELFIDLPNFTEISRELLHGVQYREKNDPPTIKMFNYGGYQTFNEEPLKLLDGIPVFTPGIFSKMGTSDIKKVDEVFYERFIGDLSFQGVLAIYTHKRSLNWIENTPGISLYNYTCLQIPKVWNLNSNAPSEPNLPDFRNVFYRNIFTEIKPESKFNFQTSDLKGQLAIRVIAVTKQNQVLYASKLIDIK